MPDIVAPKKPNDWLPNPDGSSACRSPMAWNASHAFHASSGSLATSADSPVTALGCQTTNRLTFPSPAAPK